VGKERYLPSEDDSQTFYQPTDEEVAQWQAAAQPVLEAWKEETSVGFARHAFPGGHFFMQDAEDAMIERVRRELAPLLAPPAPEDPR